MGTGSAFMHQSFTSVGNKSDNFMIGAVAYLGFRMQVQNMPNQNKMLQYLQPYQRKKNMTEVLEEMTITFQK